jgi:hypothetical protein
MHQSDFSGDSGRTTSASPSWIGSSELLVIPPAGQPALRCAVKGARLQWVKFLPGICRSNR